MLFRNWLELKTIKIGFVIKNQDGSELILSTVNVVSFDNAHAWVLDSFQGDSVAAPRSDLLRELRQRCAFPRMKLSEYFKLIHVSERFTPSKCQLSRVCFVKFYHNFSIFTSFFNFSPSLWDSNVSMHVKILF